MPLFRRARPLHERLAQEGGLAEPEPHDTTPRWGEAGIHGIARARQWDAMLAVPAEFAAERAVFVALPDGTLVVEDGPDDPSALAEAVENELPPPYRAEAVSQGHGMWAVGVRRIRVVRLPNQTGDEVELTLQGGSNALLVDGAPAFGTVPALEALLDGSDGVVRARRIDGIEWEVRVDRL